MGWRCNLFEVWGRMQSLLSEWMTALGISKWSVREYEKGRAGVQRTVRLRIKILCLPCWMSSSTILRPIPPVPPATAIVMDGIMTGWLTWTQTLGGRG
jgi:hypothetical protein